MQIIKESVSIKKNNDHVSRKNFSDEIKIFYGYKNEDYKLGLKEKPESYQPLYYALLADKRLCRTSNHYPNYKDSIN